MGIRGLPDAGYDPLRIETTSDKVGLTRSMMKCKRCGWPTTRSEYDLWSGLCAECRKIDLASFGADVPAAVRQALSAHAVRYLEQGGTPAELERNLSASGLQAEQAALVVNEAVSQHAPYKTAGDLLDQGAGVLDVRKKLMELGLAPDAAAAIVEEVQQARSGVRLDGSPRRRRSTNATLVQRVLVALGVVVFTAIVIVGGLASFKAGGLVVVGYWLAQVGQICLLVLIVRECQPDAIACAFLIPFFTWYFACQRWDIAKWAFFCNVGGTLLFFLGLCSGT